MHDNAYPAEHMNGTHGAYAPEPEARFQAWKQPPRWADKEPPYLHSLKYAIDGIEHMTVIRASDVDDLWKRVRTIMELVKAAKARTEHPGQQPPQQGASPGTPEAPLPQVTEPQQGFCSLHNVGMTRHSNAKGSWWSHKTVEGWCHDK
jgi:hypothetical protein